MAFKQRSVFQLGQQQQNVINAFPENGKSLVNIKIYHTFSNLSSSFSDSLYERKNSLVFQPCSISLTPCFLNIQPGLEFLPIQV